jgi:hypothetical protein
VVVVTTINPDFDRDVAEEQDYAMIHVAAEYGLAAANR